MIHQPIRWDSVFLLDSATQKAHTAHAQFGDLTVDHRNRKRLKHATDIPPHGGISMASAQALAE